MKPNEKCKTTRALLPALVVGIFALVGEGLKV
jgi:hypothetical protein